MHVRILTELHELPDVAWINRDYPMENASVRFLFTSKVNLFTRSYNSTSK